MLLNEIRQAEVVHSSFEAEAFMQTSASPNIILMDTSTRLQENLDQATSLLKHLPKTKIIILTHLDLLSCQAFIRKTEVHGFLVKPFGLKDLKHALEVVNEGGFYHN